MNEANMDKIKKLVATMSDREVFLFALAAVAFAGGRAQSIGRDDVEDVCVEFVDGLHLLLGFPPVRDLTVQ